MNNAMLITDVIATLTLQAETAADLMTACAVPISESATVQEAIAFLAHKGFSDAPVVDADGQPVGVLSRADIVHFDNDQAGHTDADARAMRVRDIMTAVVFSVTPDTPAPTVVRAMLQLRVHRLFVVNDEQRIIGVVSTFDILKHLKP
jgi:CBS domain-containing protein